MVCSTQCKSQGERALAVQRPPGLPDIARRAPRPILAQLVLRTCTSLTRLATSQEQVQVVGLDIRPLVGQAVIMANERDRWRGEGRITSVHASGGYVGVRWESGQQDACLFTGLQNEYHLVVADAASVREAMHPTPSSSALPEGYVLSLPTTARSVVDTRDQYLCRLTSSAAASDPLPSALDLYTAASMRYDDDEDLQKKILAQEVVKLRAECCRLQREKNANSAGHVPASIRDSILMLQARKAEAIARRAKDKKILQCEIDKMRQAGMDRDPNGKRLSWTDRYFVRG